MNRWIRLGAAVTAMIMIANLQYGWTLFVKPIIAATHWKLSEVQWGWTLFIALETWGMPCSGWLIDRYGARGFMTLAGVMCGLGWAGLGFAHSLTALYLYYSLAGFGAAIVYCGSMGVALKWFPDKRGLAAGMIAAGFGSGATLFVPILAYILKRQDYSAAFLYTGIAQGVLIMVAAQFLGGTGVVSAASRPAPKASVRSHGQEFNSLEMLQTPHFYVLYFMMLLMGVGGLLVTAQLAPVADTLKISATVLTLAATLNPLANGAGRLFWGWVSDHIGRERTMLIAFLLQAVFLTSVLTVGATTPVLFVISLLLVYFTWGEVYSLFPPTTTDYFGARNASSNYGFMYSTKGVASIIGGGIAAIIYERTGSWAAVFYGSAVLALIAALGSIGLRKMPLPRKRNAEAWQAAASPAPIEQE